MIRILVFIAIVLALGFGFSWLAERPGELFIIWQGQRIEMSLMVAATIVAVLVALVMFAWWLVRTIWTSPQSVSRFFRARKRDRGEDVDHDSDEGEHCQRTDGDVADFLKVVDPCRQQQAAEHQRRARHRRQHRARYADGNQHQRAKPQPRIG